PKAVRPVLQREVALGRIDDVDHALAGIGACVLLVPRAVELVLLSGLQREPHGEVLLLAGVREAGGLGAIAALRLVVVAELTLVEVGEASHGAPVGILLV